MRTSNSILAILIIVVVGAGFAFRSNESTHDAAIMLRLNDQLEQTKAKLADTTAQLLDAKEKLNFLDVAKAHVQVTAYALTRDFGPHPMFANNTPAWKAYAVPKHTLPGGSVLNVALSPEAERTLHAHMNDAIVLISRKLGKKHLARFVDRTAQSETRPVIDILFADAHEARIWGRQRFYAVDISRPDSPFLQN